MTEVRRFYCVNEWDQVSRIPQPHDQRLLSGASESRTFAGKVMRFAEMTLWLDDDRMITNALTWFPLIHFNSEGRRDSYKLHEEMELVLKEMKSPPDSDWGELYRAERFAAFRWTPTQHILNQLLKQLPHTPSQWAANKHISL